MEKLRKELKVDFGSGYPSDPKTKEFLAKNHENENYKDIIRHSWATVKNLKQNKSQKNLF
jgi:ribonuclease HII